MEIKILSLFTLCVPIDFDTWQKTQMNLYSALLHHTRPKKKKEKEIHDFFVHIFFTS